MPATSTIRNTGNAYVDGLLAGAKWGVTTLTYSFPTSGSYYGSSYGSGENKNGFEAMNSAQKSAIQTVLKNYSAVSNLKFTAVTESSSTHADLRFAESNDMSTAWAYFPSSAGEGGDAWFNNSSNEYDSPKKGNYAYTTLLHEIGHALGLKHPHEVEGGFGAMPKEHDSMEYTVMSYRSYVGASTSSGYWNETWGYAQTLMVDDIAAVQAMYGANYSTNSSSTKYTWNPSTGEMSINGAGQGAPGGNKIFMAVWDGGGVDTYDFSKYTTGLKVSLEPGAWSTTSSTQLAKLHYNGSQVADGNIANARLYNNDARSLIENATGGSANDAITGNSGNNTLTGNSGNDVLKGMGGADKLVGGKGADDLYGGADDLRDTFAFSGKTDSGITSNLDQIYEFDRKNSSSETVHDVIDLRSLDADTASGDQAFRFVSKFAKATGSQADGQVRVVDDGSHVRVQIDFDGNNTADMVIQVMNIDTLTQADFLL